MSIDAVNFQTCTVWNILQFDSATDSILSNEVTTKLFKLLNTGMPTKCTVSICCKTTCSTLYFIIKSHAHKPLVIDYHISELIYTGYVIEQRGIGVSVCVEKPSERATAKV